MSERRRLPPVESEPCRCGAEPVRTLGRFPYCANCADEILDDIRERVLTREGLEGVGRLVGQLRPEFGRRVADLKCSTCAATWCSIPGDPCPWCERAAADMREWQAELTLTPPDVDHDDRTYDGTMRAWAGRLDVAVKAGIVTRDRALAVWRKAVAHDTAA